MTKSFRPWKMDEAWLLPPSVQEFVPAGHPAHLVRDIVREELDLSPILSAYTEPRGYAAAQDSRASSWAASGSSATAEVGAAAPTVARRARDAVRNGPYAARIVDLWTGNAVGAGITTRWPDKPHAEAWRRWSDSTACDAEGRLDLYGLQALVMPAVVESGECFVHLLPADITPANPIGLQLQVLESDHLDTARQGVIEGVPTLQGIGLGEAGEQTGRRRRTRLITGGLTEVGTANRKGREAWARGLLAQGLVPMFLLLPQVQLAKRLDVKGAAGRAGARVPRWFVAAWEAEAGRAA